MQATRGSIVKAAALVAVVVAAAIALRAGGVSPLDLTPDRIRDGLVTRGWATPPYFLAVFLVLSLAAFPTSVLNASGGLLFGWPAGFLWVLVAVNLAGNLLFWIARGLGRDLVTRLVRGRLVALDETVGRHAFVTAFTMRLVPVVPFNASSYACGVSKMPWTPYAIATFLGMIPRAFAYSYLGGHLDPFRLEFWVAIGSLALMPAIAYAVQKRRRRDAK